MPGSPDPNTRQGGNSPKAPRESQSTPPDDSLETLANVTTMFLPPTETGHDKTRLLPVGIYPMGLSRVAMRRVFFVTFAAIIGIWFLLQVQSIVPPFVISFFLAALFDPILRRMEGKGRSRGYSIALLYIFALCILILIVVVIAPHGIVQLTEFSQNFSSYYATIQKNLDNVLHQNAALLKRLNIQQSSVSEFLNSQSSPVKNALDSLLGNITGLARALFARAFWFVIIPIATYILMLDYPHLRARIISFFPEEYQDAVDSVSIEIVDVFSDYVRGLMKICALFGFCAFLFYTALGVKFAIVLGILAGVFYAIPYVGQLATSLVVGSVAYSMSTHTALLFWHVPSNSLPYTGTVIIGTVLLGVVFDQIVYPRVVGGSVGLHPVVSMFALTAGATLFSLPGMLLAVPVAASIQVILKAMFPRLKEPPKVVHTPEPEPSS